MAVTFRMLLDDARSAATTDKALAYLDELFLAASSPGVVLAVDALRAILPAPTVTAVLTAYSNELAELLRT